MLQNPHFVYITTNLTKSVLYSGSTPFFIQRITEHYLNRGNQKSFAGRYHAFYLIYFEEIDNHYNALSREYQIKSWSRQKKVSLINEMNPEWKFLNEEIFEEWLPMD